MNDFEQIYRLHASAVFRFAWGLCGDRGRAEDIVSETFVRLLTRAPEIETRTVLAYLMAIARNVHLMTERSRGRRRELPLPDDIAARELDLPGSMDDRERLAKVVASLADLPEGERAALLLRVDHELSYEDVAAALEISVSAAKVRVHRARRRLTRQLNEQGRKP